MGKPMETYWLACQAIQLLEASRFEIDFLGKESVSTFAQVGWGKETCMVSKVNEFKA